MVFSFLKNKKLAFYSMFFLSLFFFGCGKEEKNLEDLSFDELKQKTLTLLNKKNKDEAVDCLEKMVTAHADNPNIAEFKLKLADLYFDSGNLPSAYQMYEHYKEFYPSDSKAEYASYKSILSKFYQSLKVDCDQSVTDDAIKLCDNYLNNKLFEKYKSEIKDISGTCYRKLIEKEVYVFNFYLKKGKYESAANRLKFLREKYLDKNATIEARLDYMECELAHKQKNNELYKQNLDKLVKNNPNSSYTKMAQKLSEKTVFVF